MRVSSFCWSVRGARRGYAPLFGAVCRRTTTNGLSPHSDSPRPCTRRNPLIHKERVLGTSIAGGGPMLLSRWRLLALVLIALASASAAMIFSPQRYIATGGVLMPSGMLKAHY